MFFICLSKPLVPKTQEKNVLSAQVNFSFFNSNRKAFEQKQTLVAIKWRSEHQQSPNGFGTKLEKKQNVDAFFFHPLHKRLALFSLEVAFFVCLFLSDE